ncbi:MAG: flavin prenyltransferase UbiX [Candidatus Omnitrophota bacterium]
MKKMKPYIVAITGASGVLYGVRLVQVLRELAIPVELVISDTARIVAREEMGLELGGQTPFSKVEKVEKGSDPFIHVHDFKDFTAPIASGSYPVEGMVVIPCSMGTLGAIASGLSQNLIHRAADCTIKEGRKLVLVPRETPLSAIHLENMLKLSRLGVRIVPAMPAFYSGLRRLEPQVLASVPGAQGPGQQTIQELVDFLVGKVLDQFGISHALYPRWVGSDQAHSS